MFRMGEKNITALNYQEGFGRENIIRLNPRFVFIENKTFSIIIELS